MLLFAAFLACSRYLQQRKQFGAPLASFQVNQEKLVRMLGNIQAMALLAWRLSKLYEEGTMTPGQASMAKSWITLRARETVALGRELLGGNGILSEFLVAKVRPQLLPLGTSSALVILLPISVRGRYRDRRPGKGCLAAGVMK